MKIVDENKDKKRLLFVHDHKFRSVNGKIYSTGGISDNALERYTSIFNHVTVLARFIFEENTNSKYSEITNGNVSFINGLNLPLNDFESNIIAADYIISRMPSFYGIKAIRLAKKHNKPYLIEMVGCPWDALWNHSLKGKVIAPYITWINKREVSKAPFVIYVTNEFLQRRYPTKGKSVSCSNVALEDFNEDDYLRRNNKINKLTKDSILVIGTIAAVDVKYKGQQYVIKALAKLKELGHTNFEYHLVGGGDQSYLENLSIKHNVNDQVKFLGSMPHKNVFKWLETIDIYVQPSRQEGLPRALIEAMSKGVPSFGAKTAGIPELLDEKFIFSNTSKNINEICNILINYDREEMLTQAKRNYFESKKYDKYIIEERRSVFLKEFALNKDYLCKY